MIINEKFRFGYVSEPNPSPSFERLVAYSTRDTDIFLHDLIRDEKRQGVTVSRASVIGSLVYLGICTDTLREDHKPAFIEDLSTGLVLPFDTSPLNVHNRDPYTSEYHVWAAPETSEAITLFSTRHSIHPDRAFNALLKRGKATIQALNTPDTQVYYLSKRQGRRGIVYKPPWRT